MYGNKVLTTQLNNILAATILSDDAEIHSQYDTSILDFTGERVLDITQTAGVYRIRNRSTAFNSSDVSPAVFYQSFKLYSLRNIVLTFQTSGVGSVVANIVNESGTVVWEIPSFISVTGLMNHSYSFSLRPTVFPTRYFLKITLNANIPATSYVELKSIRMR